MNFYLRAGTYTFYRDIITECIEKESKDSMKLEVHFF